MDFQNRVGNKFGTMGPATDQEIAMDRRERLRKLALETIDLSKDPYFMRNHLGSYECKLCLTLHTNEGSYLAHTQGKKHQINLARRAAKEKQDVRLLVGLGLAFTKLARMDGSSQRPPEGGRLDCPKEAPIFAAWGDV